MNILDRLFKWIVLVVFCVLAYFALNRDRDRYSLHESRDGHDITIFDSETGAIHFLGEDGEWKHSYPIAEKGFFSISPEDYLKQHPVGAK